jgi:hypothetical protein
MMKVFATIKSIAKMALWSLSSLSVGLAAVVVLSPENPSLAKLFWTPSPTAFRWNPMPTCADGFGSLHRH